MMEAEFSIRGLQFWMVDISADLSTTITINECIPWRKRGGQAMFTMSVREDEVEAVLEKIRKHSGVMSVDLVDEEEGHIIGSVAMQECPWVWKIVESGCYLERAWSNGDGRIDFKILSGSEGSLPKLIKSLGTKGAEVEINKISQINGRPIITRRQESVIKLALERGYFDCPRKITIKELAKLSKLSTSTALEIVRRGEKNIIVNYFQGK